MKNLGSYMHKHKTGIAVLLIGLCLIYIGQHTVLAQNTTEIPLGNGFRVSPVREELTIEKGQSATFDITIENPVAAEIKAEAVVNNFLPSDDESGSPRLILDENVLPPANDFKRLVQPVSDVVIPPEGDVTVQVTISVPQDARSGGYYGAVRFVPQLPGVENSNVALTASVGTLVLVQVPGDLQTRIDLLQLSAAVDGTPRGFFIGGEPSIMTRLKNSGDIHVQPFGKITVSDIFGRNVYEYEFNDTDPRANILPDSTRKFIDEFPDDIDFLGRYTITANLGYAQGSGNLITQKTTFWYFSTLAFYLLLFAILVLTSGVYWAIYRWKKKRSPHHRTRH